MHAVYSFVLTLCKAPSLFICWNRTLMYSKADIESLLARVCNGEGRVSYSTIVQCNMQLCVDQGSKQSKSHTLCISYNKNAKVHCLYVTCIHPARHTNLYTKLYVQICTPSQMYKFVATPSQMYKFVRSVRCTNLYTHCALVSALVNTLFNRTQGALYDTYEIYWQYQ